MLISLATMLISPAPAPAPAQGDPVALLMVIALGLVVLAMVLRKRFGKGKPAEPTGEVAAPVSAAPAAPEVAAPGTAGKLKLHDVDPKTAAMVMAIVADKLGKPLNELRFISIKEVKE